MLKFNHPRSKHSPSKYLFGSQTDMQEYSIVAMNFFRGGQWRQCPNTPGSTTLEFISKSTIFLFLISLFFEQIAYCSYFCNYKYDCVQIMWQENTKITRRPWILWQLYTQHGYYVLINYIITNYYSYYYGKIAT